MLSEAKQLARTPCILGRILRCAQNDRAWRFVVPFILALTILTPTFATARKNDTDRRLDAAVGVLRREGLVAVRRDQPFPRTTSNFFDRTPEVRRPTVESILNALRTELAPAERADAYVKWQLLSGLPSELDDAGRRSIATALTLAPPPVDLPGANADDQRRWRSTAARLQPAEFAAFKASFDDETRKVAAANEIILIYRNDLAARLGNDGRALRTKLADLCRRAEAGIDIETESNSLLDEIDTWTKSAGESEQKIMRQYLESLLALPERERLIDMSWQDGVVWRTAAVGPDRQRLRASVALMNRRAP